MNEPGRSPAPPQSSRPRHPQVYAPDEDTFLLLSSTMREIRLDDLVLEIGTGSGSIAREISKFARVVATDINPHACREAFRQGVEVIRTDLAAGLKGPFDLVVFNPPYLPTREEERLNDWLEYALDGGETGRETIERFVRSVDRVLSPHGRILLLISSLTGVEEVRSLSVKQGYIVFIAAKKKIEGEKLYVLRMHRDLCRCPMA